MSYDPIPRLPNELFRAELEDMLFILTSEKIIMRWKAKGTIRQVPLHLVSTAVTTDFSTGWFGKSYAFSFHLHGEVRGTYSQSWYMCKSQEQAEDIAQRIMNAAILYG